jgi:hypothetical protein
MNNNNLIYGLVGIGIGYYITYMMGNKVIPSPSSNVEIYGENNEVDNMLQYQQEVSAYKSDSFDRPLNPDEVYVYGLNNTTNPQYSTNSID